MSEAAQPIDTIPRGRLFRKYVGLFAAVVCAALIANGLLDIWFSYQEQKALLIRVQREQADATAAKIGQFIKEIEGQIGWTTQMPWTVATLDQLRLDTVRLLRQVPAITEIAQLDASGREQLVISRLAMDVIGSGIDRSQTPKFIEAVVNTVYYGPIYFRRESEPYMTLALAGARRGSGVTIAEVNLKFIWDVVSQIKVDRGGWAYVVDAAGRLIAHPDLSLVLRNTDLSGFAQVQAARAASFGAELEPVQVADDLHGRRVLTAYAPVAPLGWFVFVELPIDQAYAPLYASITRAGLLLLGALIVAVLAGVFLARRMIVPIQALRAGAARIGGGDLAQRIRIETGDELEALGDQFNRMAAQLQESYATLEGKVEERTRQLELANLAKSRFLAAASHDLRQPLHALGLFIAQLRGRVDAIERRRLIDRIDAAVDAMNELFNALLDISRLDAGVLAPNVLAFPISRVLERIESTFAGAAREKGLALRVVPSTAWVRSDPILLERILLNLVSNAVRYTSKGGVVVGCRRHGGDVRIDVCDSGVGIPEDQRRNIFGEFYRLGETGGNRDGGLGLGLAIVERLCALLGHAVDLDSIPGRGSRFGVAVPSAAEQLFSHQQQSVASAGLDVFRNALVVVIDDDALVLDGMHGLLASWGCAVVAAGSESAARSELAERGAIPDLIVSDYRLPHGKTGIGVIEDLRALFGAPIAAFLISGDTAPEGLREARESGFHLLHKPVSPMALRAMVHHLLRKDSGVAALVMGGAGGAAT